jgi:hypothetical protein
VAHRVRERIEAAVKRADVRSFRCDDRVFLWPLVQSPAEYQSFRAPGFDERSRRDASDIAPEEVAAAALCVLASQVSLPMSDLIREAARLLGFQRTGQTVDQYIRKGVELLLGRGCAAEQNGMIVHQG